MNISLNWIREWVPTRQSPAALAARLTLAGVEAGVRVLDAPPDGVVVGRILDVAPHPQADRLQVCAVETGPGRRAIIVCGAPNTAAGLKVPVALPGTTLPGGAMIAKVKLRGVDSAGMLCSAVELGLAEKSEGLLVLDPGARVGQSLARHLGLPDHQVELEITPNRGDCLSVAGVSRELAAILDLDLSPPGIRAARVTSRARVAVRIEDRKGCPRYAGRVVSGIDAGARTPDWMRERLRRSGMRAIHPVVDITNYVMLEFGQPMHAFDLARLDGGIVVRHARRGERMTLLDGSQVRCAADDLMITDAKRPLALAGIMGGEASGVSEDTSAIFLESALFRAERVAATGRRLKTLSDSRYRFERGVDADLQRRALERATALVLEICGGAAGPVTEAGQRKPRSVTVRLRRERMDALLGIEVPERDVAALLRRLGLAVRKVGPGRWQTTVPSWRHDLRIEEDLVEDVGRLYGYDRIPARRYRPELAAAPLPESRRTLAEIRERLVGRGWQEAITYSFVAPSMQQRLDPDAATLTLDNPIADTLSVMRSNLWCGLLPAWRYNRQRQQDRIRLFEIGACFLPGPKGRAVEESRIGGIASGGAWPEQWDGEDRRMDLHDLRGDLEALLGPGGGNLALRPDAHPALHPGRCARLLHDDAPVGWAGELHPEAVRALDLPEAPLLFEIQLDAVRRGSRPRARPVPGHPSSRRDLAVVVKESVSAEELVGCVRAAGGEWLSDVRVFDIFRGEGLPKACKSVALGLIFQHYSRTLTDEEVASAADAVADRLANDLGASIRG